MEEYLNSLPFSLTLFSVPSLKFLEYSTPIEQLPLLQDKRLNTKSQRFSNDSLDSDAGRWDKYPIADFA